MKKYLVSIASLAALVGLVACQKTEIKPSPIAEGSTFTLAADIEQTKTTLNGLEVNWEEGDILYLVTTDETWGKPYPDDKECATIAEYTYADGEFTSKATIGNGSYTFNALYGSASQKSYHRGASTTYSLQATQTQDCTNPTAHLKNNDALVGSFTASVPRTTPASVTMSHIFAIMRVDVKNATGSDVELKSFEMSAAGANLAGIYTVNFAKSPIDITEKSGQSSSIKVNLTNGTVAAGESLPVYFVMAPLANYSGDVTFTVTDADDKVYTKTVSLTNISFEAGSLNTTPFKITAASTGGKTVLFTEGFGNNSDSAREWNDSYKEQGGISSVYSSSTYTITNAKQSKNTIGNTNSALIQTTKGKDAVFEVKSLDVSGYSDLTVSYFWKAASVKGTYSTSLYYSIDNGDTYTEVKKDSGTGATSYVEVKYTLPAAAVSSNLCLKVIFNTSNTQAFIDDFVLEGYN